MADETKLIISIETILRGLDKTLKGLEAIDRKLKSVGKGTTTATSNVAVDKSIRRQQEKLKKAEESLQRQRSAALIAEENRRLRAVEALQKQRSSALIEGEKKRAAEITRINKQQAAAVASLQRQRSAALIKEEDAVVKSIARNQKRQEAAVISLQRQRSAALITQSKEAEKAAKAQERARPQLDAHVQAFRRAEAASAAYNAKLLSLGNSARSAGQGLTSLGFILTAALTAPLVGLGVASTNAAVTLDSLKRGLTAIVGSATDAGIQLRRLTEIAKLPGIGFEEAIQGSIRLQAVGFSAADAEKALIQFSNAVALTGGGREELSRITVQLGQLAAKGKVLSQDLRPIIEAAPAVGKALKAAFGTVNADDIAELTGSSQEFFNILTKELERLPRAAAGARNSFENFRDAIFRASATIGEALLPSLTALIEVAEPIITKLAEGFSLLPPIMQRQIIAFGLLAASIGPVLLLVGPLTLGFARLVVAIAQLNALGGLVAVTAKLHAFTAGASAAITSLTGLSAATIAAVAPWAALAAVLVIAGGALLIYSRSQKDAVKVTDDQIRVANEQAEALEKQLKFLTGLSAGVKRTTDEQEKLDEVYRRLNLQAPLRVEGIDAERESLETLRVEIERLLRLRNEERLQQAATVAASLIETAATIDANEKQLAAIAERIQLNSKLRDSLIAGGKATAEDARVQRDFNVQFGDTAVVIRALQAENEKLLSIQNALRDTTTKLNGTAEEQAKTLAELEKRGVGTARQFLEVARSIGIFQGNIEEALASMRRFAEQQNELEKATDGFTRALKLQSEHLLLVGKEADEQAKARRAEIGAASSLAREASSDLQGALKFMDAFIKANPNLRAAIEKERQLAGKSFQEFINDAIGIKDREKGGTALRNAQERLAEALVGVAQAGAEREEAINRAKNEALLQQNENDFRLQIVAYRQYLLERQRLTSFNLQLEINKQKRIVEAAVEEQRRLGTRAGQRGVPQVERVRAQVGVVEAREREIVAQTRINNLIAEQKALAVEVAQALAEQAQEQERDIRQLQIEYGELTGRIEEALNAATDERFREELLRLGKAQDDLNKRVQLFGQLLTGEQKQQIELARQRNQTQIDLINNTIEQERALNRLQAAEQFVANAKRVQSDLEKQITFDVEFRGLKEEEAIRRRLAGEERFRNQLQLSHNVIQGTIDDIRARLGAEFPVPQALLDFIKDLELAMKGLGELSFTEQFRLAEKEFTRIQDELSTKIADVERAIRSRDIAEIQGRLLIKRLNGEYIGELEAQLELLKQIARESGDEGLQRQARSAEQAVKDTRAAAEELDDFNKALKSVAIDSFNDSLSQLFRDLRDNTESAAQDILNFFNNLLNAVNDFIGQELARRITESLFPKSEDGKGVLDTLRKVIGFGGGDDKGTAGTQVGIHEQIHLPADSGAVALQTAATTVATSLTTAGASTAAALTSGGSGAAAAMVSGGSTVLASLTTSAATFATGISTAAAAFASTVIAAGAAFAAAVAASSATQGLGGIAGGGGAASGNILESYPGGRVIRVAEAGYDEAVLTTDPKHAARQTRILVEYLKRTKGLFGRFEIPRFAEGGFAAELDMLNSIRRSPSPSAGTTPQVALAESGSQLNLRQVLVDDRDRLGDFLNSPQGEQVMVTWLTANQHKYTRRR